MAGSDQRVCVAYGRGDTRDRPRGPHVEVTKATDEIAIYPCGDWVHLTRRGALQVRAGRCRRTARYPVGSWRNFIIRGDRDDAAAPRGDPASDRHGRVVVATCSAMARKPGSSPRTRSSARSRSAGLAVSPIRTGGRLPQLAQRVAATGRRQRRALPACLGSVPDRLPRAPDGLSCGSQPAASAAAEPPGAVPPARACAGRPGAQGAQPSWRLAGYGCLTLARWCGGDDEEPAKPDIPRHVRRR